MRVLKILCIFLGGSLCGILACRIILAREIKSYTYDGRMAVGEWMIQVQTPPCEGVGHIQVIYPQQDGYPIEVECDQMPVGEK
jgi:hypothetical protein